MATISSPATHQATPVKAQIGGARRSERTTLLTGTGEISDGEYNYIGRDLLLCDGIGRFNVALHW